MAGGVVGWLGGNVAGVVLVAMWDGVLRAGRESGVFISSRATAGSQEAGDAPVMCSLLEDPAHH